MKSHIELSAQAHCIFTTFVLHSGVVEITGKVLISHLRHEPIIPGSDHASIFCLSPAMLEHKAYYAFGCSSFFVSEIYPQCLAHPASTECAYRQAVAPLDGAHQ